MPDDFAVGRQVAAVRLSKNASQAEVAARAGFSRSVVSRVERGILDGSTVASLRALSRALGMPSLVTLGWRGPEVDRLTDAIHAALVEAMVSELSARGWLIASEFSFSHYGERGSVDVLAWHAPTATLLIVEIKSRLWDLQNLLSTLDRKRRLVPALVRRQLGWQPAAVGVLLVMPDSRSHRRSIARHEATFRASLPERQASVKKWIQSPNGSLRGILLLSIAHQVCTRQKARRLRRPRGIRNRPSPSSRAESGLDRPIQTPK